VDSSVEYARLCVYESLEGETAYECRPIADYQDGAAGSCVLSPLERDRTKYNGDRQNFIDALHDGFPVASAIISAGGFCWSGTKGSVITEGEPDPEDSFGDMYFTTAGSGRDARISLEDLQTTFETLYQKHEFADQEGRAVLLFDVDNSGSIRVSQWPASVKDEFLSWVASEYPNVIVRETTISNYISDGEDWIRRQMDNYLNLQNEYLAD